MRRKIAAVALAATVGLTGVTLFVPGVASAQEQPGQATGIGERMGSLQQALKSLVTDGTLNQEQADKVAAAVARERAERPGPGRGHGRDHGRGGKRGADGVKLAPAAVAEALGMEVGRLRAEQRAGKTLAQIAADKGLAGSAAGAAGHRRRVPAGREGHRRRTHPGTGRRTQGRTRRAHRRADRPSGGWPRWQGAEGPWPRRLACPCV